MSDVYGARATVDGVEWVFCCETVAADPPEVQAQQRPVWWSSGKGLVYVSRARHLQLAIAGIWQAVFPQKRRKNR